MPNKVSKMSIRHFCNVFKLMDISSALSPVISHFIQLLLSMWFLFLVSTLHTLVVATSDKPRTSFAVVKNNLLLTEYAWNLNTLRKSPIELIICFIIWCMKSLLPFYDKRKQVTNHRNLENWCFRLDLKAFYFQAKFEQKHSSCWKTLFKVDWAG